MTPASKIAFPFEREVYYSLDELKRFEQELLNERQENPELSDELRAPVKGSPPWIKARNEELVPFLYYSNHSGLPNVAQFKMMPHGHPIDIDVSHAGGVESLQITTAYADWCFPDTNVRTRSGGHLHRVETEILNRDGTGRWGPLIETDGKISQDQRAVSTEELEPVHFNGLVEALKRKFEKQCNYDCTLLVHAKKYYEAMTIERFERLTHAALDSARSQVSQPSWIKKICILDKGADYFVDSP